jgi:hypothetical protein
MLAMWPLAGVRAGDTTLTSIPVKLVAGGGGEEGEKHEGVEGNLLGVLDGVGEVSVGLPTVRQRRRPGRTARRCSGVRAGKEIGRTAARG